MSELTTIVINDELSIPPAELQFRFSTSSGPGGQHVNRSATRVTLLFDIAGSPSLADPQRERLLKKLAKRLDKDGVLQITVQEFRSQRKNRDTAVARFQELLATALVRPKKRKPTRPGRAAREKRLAEKKKLSQKKADRKSDW